MDVAIRTSIRKLLVAALVVAALGVGFAVGGRSSAASRHSATAPAATKKYSVSDLLLAASTAQGIHLHYAGITTGAVTADHANDVPISSFQFGVSRAFSNPLGGTRTGGQPSVSEITLTHQTDKFSLPLLNQSLRGNTGANASLFFTDLSGAGGTPFDFLQIDLTQTLLSSFSMSSGGDTPSESFSLNFITMAFRYRISGGATQTVAYNLATGS